MRIELDIYSGRPNPSWELSPDEAAALLIRLRALPKGTAGAIEAGLGYRGLVVTAPGGVIDGFDRVTISAGSVVGHGLAGDRVLVDTDRSLELWLLHTGRGRIDDELYRALITQFGSAQGR